MGLDERLGFLILGGLAGFVLGYIVRSQHDIKEELDDVKDILKQIRSDERGSFRFSVTSASYLFATLLTVIVSGRMT